MSSYWKNKVVLVTGGSKGLGLAIGEAFADAGCRVVLAARDADILAQSAESLRGRRANVLDIPTDITNENQVQQLFQQVRDNHGQLDVLVNSVGSSSRSEITATTTDDFQRLLELNFLGLVRCTRAAIPSLLASQGHVVNIASLAAKTAGRYMGAYPVSKFAVAAYSQQLRLELGPQGLHVLLVCPGPIKRDDAGQRYNEQAVDLPDTAQRPGAGAKLARIDPSALARKIVTYCERRKPELVAPGRARLLFAIAQLSPTLGDWILKRMT